MKKIIDFQVSGIEVHSWSTYFTIKSLSHENESNAMSPEAFFHHLGHLCGKELDEIEGLKFSVIIESDVKNMDKDSDPLYL